MSRAVVLTLLFALFLHAADLPAGELDFFTPEMQRLKREYKQETDKHSAARLQDLSRLVQENLAEARTLLEGKKASGNIRGMAIGKKSVKIFEKCAEDLKSTRDFSLPTRVRRELKDTISVCKTKKKAIEEKHGVFLDPLREKFYQLFIAQVQAQSGEPMAEDKSKELFSMLIATEDRVQAKPKVGGEGEKGPEGGGETTPAIVVPEILASSGVADSWVSFGRLYAESHNLEMIRLPVMNVREVRKGSGGGEMSGSPYKMLYRPIQVLQPAEGLVFRLKSIPRRLGMQVVEWPNARNRWTMLVRVRPRGKLPASFGAELQVNVGAPLGGTAVGPVETGGASKGPKVARRVKVPVLSKPAGATVFLDGQPYRPGDVPFKTPCVVVATEGMHTFKLMLLGYMNGVKKVEVKPGARVEWSFSKDMGMKEVIVKAYARTGWRSSRIRVAKGDVIKIVTFGSWSCGTDREMVNGNGYSSRAYSKYYSTSHGDRRLTKRSAYGSLLLRFGAKGPMGSIGKGRQLTAPAAGELFFGINERAKWLGDNSGSLTIKVQKSSGG